MQNLFYVPPHQPQDIHPKPVGVRTVVKRNQPTRLDLSVHAHPAALNAGLVTLGDIAAEPELGPKVDMTTRTGPMARMRRAIGAALVRTGQKIAGDSTLPLGQPT